MSTAQAVTETRTRVLTDEVRTSPVDEYLDRAQSRLWWGLIAVLVILAIIL